MSKKLYFFAGIVVTIFFICLYGHYLFPGNPAAKNNTPLVKAEEPGGLFPQRYRIVVPPIPDDLNFAGETVPLNQFDVRERVERELIANTYWHSFTILAIKRASRFFPVIEPILKQYGIPEDFKYLAVIESGLANVVSSAGATGFWQLMKEPAELYGLEINSEVDERYNLERSTEAACKYLRKAYVKFGNWTLAAASYNMGLSGITKQLDRQFSDNYYDLYLNDETSRYVARILSLKEIMKNPEAFGFDLAEEELYPPYQQYDLNITSPIDNLAEFARKKGFNYKILRIYNPWLRNNKLTNKSGRQYTLKVPIGVNQ